MTQQNKIQIFEERKERTLWVDEAEVWYFSIVDVVAVLTDILKKILYNKLHSSQNKFRIFPLEIYNI